MKRFIITFIIGVAMLGGGVVAMTSCDEQYARYDGASYVMFADTLSIYPVQMPQVAGHYSAPFAVPVVATRTADHDRVFAVRILDKGDAVYGKQYRLESSTVTIPAGKNRADVLVRGMYDNIESYEDERDKEPELFLKLMQVNEDGQLEEWGGYKSQTAVTLRKSCPFDINNFTGYCLVASTFLNSMIYEKQTVRLIETELVADEENTVLLKDFFFDGYDIKIRFDPSDLLKPRVSFVGKQLVGDSREAFIEIYGDGRMWVDNYEGYDSEFFGCDRVALVYSYLTFSNFTPGGEEYPITADGAVLEWITDTEALDYL